MKRLFSVGLVCFAVLMVLVGCEKGQLSSALVIDAKTGEQIFSLQLDVLCDSDGYAVDICVDENARGKHVGKALYEYVRDYAKSIGCNNITLNVWEGNEPALHFYRNMGMQVQNTTMEIILS